MEILQHAHIQQLELESTFGIRPKQWDSVVKTSIVLLLTSWYCAFWTTTSFFHCKKTICGMTIIAMK